MPIRVVNIANMAHIKLANINALDACLPSLIAPMKAITHITPSMTAISGAIPFRYFVKVYRLVVSVALRVT